MTRDMDLVRQLLVYFADRNDTHAVKMPDIPGDYDPALIEYHLNMLYEAGWLAAEPERTKTGRVIRVHAFDLTWAGHDFLASIRNESVWTKVKSSLVKVGGSASVDLIKAAAVYYAKTTLSIGG